MARLYFLFSALSAIAFATEHLAVFSHGLSARVPRGDVVCFHLRQLKMLSAVGAETALPLVGRQFLRIRERPDGQVFFLTSENVRIDAGLLGHIIIQNQPLYFIVNLLIVKYFIFKLLV